MNFKINLFLWVIIRFINITLNVNQQGTLKIVDGRVYSFSNDLIHIFVIKAQFANLGINSCLLFKKTKYFATCRPHGSSLSLNNVAYISW